MAQPCKDAKSQRRPPGQSREAERSLTFAGSPREGDSLEKQSGPEHLQAGGQKCGVEGQWGDRPPLVLCLGREGQSLIPPAPAPLPWRAVRRFPNASPTKRGAKWLLRWLRPGNRGRLPREEGLSALNTPATSVRSTSSVWRGGQRGLAFGWCSGLCKPSCLARSVLVICKFNGGQKRSKLRQCNRPCCLVVAALIRDLIFPGSHPPFAMESTR